MDKRVVATWSGGIDSTGVIANLLFEGYEVTAVSLRFGGDAFVSRERVARLRLVPHLETIARENGGKLYTVEAAGTFLWAFSSDGVEIPTRNKRIIDHLIAVWCPKADTKNIGMGEYIGCDTWVVRDHVGAEDCDARSLTAYVYEQYGMDYRLFTLADFGESRYKSDRVRIGADVLGDAMSLTTNCLNDAEVHCGECYKCLERAVAFDIAGVEDLTVYARPPREHPHAYHYLAQMRGEGEAVPHKEFEAVSQP